MIIWGAAGKYGRRIHRRLTRARRSGELSQIVAGEDELMRPTVELKTIVELIQWRASLAYLSSVDGFASSGKAKERGSD